MRDEPRSMLGDVVFWLLTVMAVAGFVMLVAAASFVLVTDAVGYLQLGDLRHAAVPIMFLGAFMAVVSFGALVLIEQLTTEDDDGEK